MKNTLLAIALGSILTGVVHARQDDVDTYLALANRDQSPDLRKLGAFAGVFEDLLGDGLEKRINDAYAEKLYFNDTLVTLTTRDELINYMRDTQRKANYVRTEILDVARSGEDFYVRWLLEMEFEVLGSNRVSRTVGMSHLRFDGDSKIVLHRDFWDSAHGLYVHMPIIGGLIKWMQGRFQPADASSDAGVLDSDRSISTGE